MLNYKMITYTIESDQGVQWIAEFPKLAGVLGTGHEIQSAVQDLLNNAKAHIELMRELEMDVPTEDALIPVTNFSGRITYRPGKKMHKQIQEQAEKEEISINSFINNAVSYYLGELNSVAAINQIAERFEHIIRQQTEEFKYLSEYKVDKNIPTWAPKKPEYKIINHSSSSFSYGA